MKTEQIPGKIAENVQLVSRFSSGFKTFSTTVVQHYKFLSRLIAEAGESTCSKTADWILTQFAKSKTSEQQALALLLT